MLTYVLGAPGSGKSTVAPLLRGLVRSHVVLDWDAFIPAASELAARDVRRSPSTWPSYRHLVRAVVETISPVPIVLLGVCAPDELEGWPIDAWILLDCSDEERQRRLAANVDAPDVTAVLADAARYRTFGLHVIDTTARTPQSIAHELAHVLHDPEN